MDDLKRQQILAAALKAFWKHGYRRVSMKEIAEAAGISRPGLYLRFRTKEEVFSGVIRQMAEVLLEEIRAGIERKPTAEDKIRFVFEVWTVRTFGEFLKSPETRELMECSFDFARDALEESYVKVESVIASVLRQFSKSEGARKLPAPDTTARILASAVRGFKQVAGNPANLRKMIEDLIRITLGPG
jgi:AcrR family transcriptional regulator